MDSIVYDTETSINGVRRPSSVVSETCRHDVNDACMDLLTVDRRRRDARPDGHEDVDDDEPERDERHKVVELIRTIHHQTQDDDEEVETNQHLTTAVTQSLSSLTLGDFTLDWTF